MPDHSPELGPVSAKWAEEDLQKLADEIGEYCSVWYGAGARDIETILRRAIDAGLVIRRPFEGLNHG